MIRAATHSSYPRVGEAAFAQEIRFAERRAARGRIDRDELREIEDRTAGLAVAEQARAFVDVVTDGLVRWDGLLARWSRHLEGLRPGRPWRWFDTVSIDRRPEVIGDLGWPGPMTVREFEVAQDVAGPRAVKMVLPGPVLVARLADGVEDGGIARVAREVARATAREVGALAAAGCRVFQLEEPLLAGHPGDVDLVAETAAEAFAGAGDGAATILSVSFGDPSPLADRVHALPGTHLGLDACAGDGAFELLRRIPEGRGVQLGLFDVLDGRVEDAADVRARLDPYRDLLTVRDVLVAPRGGLEPLPRDTAYDKLQQARYLAETLREGWAWSS